MSSLAAGVVAACTVHRMGVFIAQDWDVPEPVLGRPQKAAAGLVVLSQLLPWAGLLDLGRPT